MTKKEKELIVSGLIGEFSKSKAFYIVKPYGLRVKQVDIVRRSCFEKNVEYKVVKNTFIFKALLKVFGDDWTGFNHENILKGPSAIFFIKEEDLLGFPARLIKSLGNDGLGDNFMLKCAVVDRDVYVGHEKLGILVSFKSKNEMIGGVVSALKGSLQTVLSSLGR